MPSLFAVLLGGNCAPRSNAELHDVVFAVGDRIDDVLEQLPDLWFGTLDGLHIDSWVDLSVADGHRVTLQRERPAAGPHLYFINLGAYLPGAFAEQHASTFLVADHAAEVERRARADLLRGYEQVHTDDLHEVGGCLRVDEVGGWHVALAPTTDPATTRPHNGYLPLPPGLLARHAARRNRSDSP